MDLIVDRKYKANPFALKYTQYTSSSVVVDDVDIAQLTTELQTRSTLIEAQLSHLASEAAAATGPTKAAAAAAAAATTTSTGADKAKKPPAAAAAAAAVTHVFSRLEDVDAGKLSLLRDALDGDTNGAVAAAVAATPYQYLEEVAAKGFSASELETLVAPFVAVRDSAELVKDVAAVAAAAERRQQAAVVSSGDGFIDDVRAMIDTHVASIKSDGDVAVDVHRFLRHVLPFSFVAEPENDEVRNHDDWDVGDGGGDDGFGDHGYDSDRHAGGGRDRRAPRAETILKPRAGKRSVSRLLGVDEGDEDDEDDEDENGGGYEQLTKSTARRPERCLASVRMRMRQSAAQMQRRRQQDEQTKEAANKVDVREKRGGGKQRRVTAAASSGKAKRQPPAPSVAATSGGGSGSGGGSSSSSSSSSSSLDMLTLPLLRQARKAGARTGMVAPATLNVLRKALLNTVTHDTAGGASSSSGDGSATWLDTYRPLKSIPGGVFVPRDPAVALGIRRRGPGDDVGATLGVEAGVSLSELLAVLRPGEYARWQQDLGGGGRAGDVDAADADVLGRVRRLLDARERRDVEDGGGAGHDAPDSVYGEEDNSDAYDDSECGGSRHGKRGRASDEDYDIFCDMGFDLGDGDGGGGGGCGDEYDDVASGHRDDDSRDASLRRREDRSVENEQTKKARYDDGIVVVGHDAAAQPSAAVDGLPAAMLARLLPVARLQHMIRERLRPPPQATVLHLDRVVPPATVAHAFPPAASATASASEAAHRYARRVFVATLFMADTANRSKAKAAPQMVLEEHPGQLSTVEVAYAEDVEAI
jgi:hypothetical protein